MELRLLRYFVAVAEERHVGRAAARLRMTQPPLSRAIKQLEGELGVVLLTREPHGVQLTTAGTALYREARALLDRAEHLSARVSTTACAPTIAVGTCADTADQLGSRLITEFRHRQPEVGLTLYESDLTDPTAGLRTGVVDVALTRSPFDETGIAVHVLRLDPLGVVMPGDDPLAHRRSVSVTELTGRRWIRLPEGTDRLWRAYWSGGDWVRDEDTIVIRTIQESLQSVLWSNTTTFAPLNQVLPEGLVNVRLVDKEPSRLVVAWRSTEERPFVRSFVEIAVAVSLVARNRSRA